MTKSVSQIVMPLRLSWRRLFDNTVVLLHTHAQTHKAWQSAIIIYVNLYYSGMYYNSCYSDESCIADEVVNVNINNCWSKTASKQPCIVDNRYTKKAANNVKRNRNWNNELAPWSIWPIAERRHRPTSNVWLHVNIYVRVPALVAHTATETTILI